jgi:leucyl aminopeptidase (aminopeptidase T)
MYDEMMMLKRAHTIVDLAQVQKSEKVLVLCDYTTATVGKMLVSQIYQMDALPILTIIPPRKSYAESVPQPVVEMAMNVDAIISPMATSWAHTPLRTEALKAGIRVMIIGGFTEEFLASGVYDVDFHELRPKCDQMADLLTKAKIAKATTAKGTDITMSLEGRKGQSLSGFAVKGVLAVPPGMEALCCPVEGIAEGKIVCEVCIRGLPPGLPFKDKLLSEPMEIVVHEGLVKDIKGGAEAKQFKEWLESLNDPTVYTIAELGVGMNPHIKKFDGSSRDEAVVGGIHVGIGENWCFPGGSIKSSAHCDFVISNNVTLELDGKAVLKEGKLLI